MATNTEKFNLSSNVTYEITINPDDRHQYGGKGDTRIQNVKSDLDDIFKNQNEDILLHLLPEISTPQFGNNTTHKLARIHYHGVILLRTDQALRKFLLCMWHKITSISSIQLNPYRPDHWPVYCRKQQALFSKKERVCTASWIDCIV